MLKSHLQKYTTLGKEADTPEEAVEEFMKAYLLYDKELFLEYVYPTAPFGVEPFSISSTEQWNSAVFTALKAFSVHHTFEILNIDRSADFATADISLSYYNATPYFISVETAYRAQANDFSIYDFANYLTADIATNFDISSYEPSSVEFTLQLRNVNDRWYVEQPYQDVREYIFCNLSEYVEWTKQ